MRKLAAFLPALALLAFTPASKAAMDLTYQINGGTVTQCGTGTSAGPVTCGSISSGGVAITNFSGLSNSPGGNVAQEFSSTLDINNTSGSTATVILWVSSQDFANPNVPPGTITWSNEESLDGTLGTTTGNAIDCINTNNALEPGGVGTSTPTYCTASGAMSLSNVAQTVVDADSKSNTTKTVITALSSGYSLSTEIILTLSAGADMHFQDSQILTLVPTPEPTSIVLLGGALLGLTMTIRRKASRRS